MSYMSGMAWFNPQPALEHRAFDVGKRMKKVDFQLAIFVCEGGAESTATSPPNEEPKAGISNHIVIVFPFPWFFLLNYHNKDKIRYDIA